MPLPFRHVCDLLEQCSRLCAARQQHHPAVVSWFGRHRTLIDAHDTNVAALLSTLLPEKRTDRVYGIQAPSLEKIIGRALMLGSSRMKELAMHKEPGSHVDLADCVERILLVTPNPELPAYSRVTVEYIDKVLHSLASSIRWSSPKVRNDKTTMTHESRGELEALYIRFTPVEAKWFTRLVLKNYEPLIFQSEMVYGLCDKALPSALKVLDDFVIAIKAVQLAKTRLIRSSSRGSVSGNNLLTVVKPQLGVKVGRQPWLKARSIKHCLDMGHGQMSVERKIDGEYCQIHVDLSKPGKEVQIFSKSGKDSTEDRKKVHGVIVDSLRQGLSGFSIKQRCILEGELVVYSHRERKIRPFHTIRNYVTRRGRFLNTEQDSPPKSYEHLMVVYFDALSVDDRSLLDLRHSERRKELERIVKQNPGRSEIVHRQVIDFGHHMAASHLRKAFASVIMQRGEGLVVKPDEPYFDFSTTQRRHASSCIKLKKEYIGNFGEIGDFAVVGAGFDPAKAKSYGIPELKWTHFYLGCLNNKEEVQRWGAKAEFTVTSIVEMNGTLLKSFVANTNTDAVPLAENTFTTLRLAVGLVKRPTLKIVFTHPPVVDLRCFSFDKEGNTGFWTPRFPGVSKIHFDRDFTDAITFDELQVMAKDATGTPELEDSQENLDWIAKLEAADPRGVAVDAVSQLTASSRMTPTSSRRTRSFSAGGSPTSPVSPLASKSQPVAGRAAAAQVLAIPLQLTRPAPLPMTPPTSSDLQEASPSSGKKCSTIKRTLEARGLGSKRRKSEAHARAPLIHNRASQQTSHSREPLGNLEPNSSQNPNISGSQAVACHDKPQMIIDLTSSPASSQPSIRSDLDAPYENLCRSEEDTTVITMPENTSLSEMKPQRHKEFLAKHTIPTVSQTEGSKSPEHYGSKCTFSGSGCSLAKLHVVIAPYLVPNVEVARRLTDHGIDSLAFNIKACAAGWGQSPERICTKTILLVDSLCETWQTKQILDGLENLVMGMPKDSRPYIHVYDWRVLDNITLLEDRSITTKEFDGFRDPWTRWQIGVV